MKVLLVYPEYPDTFWSFKHANRFISRKAAFPPLGLMTIAAMLPEDWEIRLADMNVRYLKDKEIAWADMVFISAMLIQGKSAQEVIDRCGQAGKKVVAGGPAFTASYGKFTGVDHLILNEAEVTLPFFLSDLKNGEAKHIYTSEKKPELDSTPVPIWSLIKLKDYSSMAIQYSRGCPFDCEFCDITAMYGRKVRIKPADSVIDELDSLKNAGWRGAVFFVDDNFIGHKGKVKDLLLSLIQWQKDHGYPFSFFTEASVNLAEDEDLMRLMSLANFDKVFLGIETTNMDSLKECNKYQNTKLDLGEAVTTIHSYGMAVMGGFIVGFDHDDNSIFESLTSFIQKTGVTTAMVGILSALPKTKLWQRLKSENRLLDDASGENTDGSLNFIPKMDKEALTKGYQQLISKIYSPKQYYRRAEQFIKNYHRTVRKPVTWSDIRAFLRSIFRIGIFSRAKFFYWRLLFRTFFTNIRAFPVAVEIAILGFHFEKVARKLPKL